VKKTVDMADEFSYYVCKPRRRVMENLIITVKLLLSAVLGGIIGYEREEVGKPAGFRTLMLVSLGACLFMLISSHIAKGLPYADPTRVASQVVVGVGFLGAGAIFHAGVTVVGLTTAASIWVVAAVGLAVGAGLYYAGVVATVLTLVIIRVAKKILSHREKRNRDGTSTP